MLAGTLAAAGFFMGRAPLPADFRPGANPKGLFEDRETVAINEGLLASHFPRHFLRLRRRVSRLAGRDPSLPRGLRWAEALSVDTDVVASGDLAARMQAQVCGSPFCFKDPRFSFTLPAWRPYIGDAVLVCIFREPARTATSLVTEWSRHPGRTERDRMTYQRALRHWRAAYTNILGKHRLLGEWIFVHYDQVIDGSAVSRLERDLHVHMDHSFPDSALKRTPLAGQITSFDRNIYNELCRLAGTSPSA